MDNYVTSNNTWSPERRMASLASEKTAAQKSIKEAMKALKEADLLKTAVWEWKKDG